MVKNPPANAEDVRDTAFDPWVGKIPQRRAWQPTPVFLSMENHMDRGTWQAAVPRVTQSRTRLKRLNMHTHKPNHRSFLFRKKNSCHDFMSWSCFYTVIKTFKTLPIFSSTGIFIIKKKDRIIYFGNSRILAMIMIGMNILAVNTKNYC